MFDTHLPNRENHEVDLEIGENLGSAAGPRPFGLTWVGPIAMMETNARMMVAVSFALWRLALGLPSDS